jgi:hypothetical protein
MYAGVLILAPVPGRSHQLVYYVSHLHGVHLLVDGAGLHATASVMKDQHTVPPG